MKVEKFDFRRLYATWDDSLVGKRCIVADTIEEILEAVENGIDESEVISSRGCSTEEHLPFWSEKAGDYFCYAYVLDEDFVEEEEEPLAVARWFRADVEAVLDKKLEDGEITSVSDSDVDAVIDCVAWSAMEGAMIERGWDFIDMAVDEYVDERRGYRNEIL